MSLFSTYSYATCVDLCSLSLCCLTLLSVSALQEGNQAFMDGAGRGHFSKPKKVLHFSRRNPHQIKAPYDFY